MSFIPFLLGAADATVQAGEAGGNKFGMLGSLVPFLLIILIFYFFMIRPQSKKQKETEKMLNALKKGDKIITIGGIHGVVSSVKENTVIVKVDDGCKIEFNRSAISTVLKSEAELAKEKEEAAQKKGLFGFGKKKVAEAKAEESAKNEETKSEEAAEEAVDSEENK
ncbi:MAG: preprotein translocase subunit YajC [Treponema sp.]|nr:preprotein translocase subunit YajC [Treponema sp.]